MRRPALATGLPTLRPAARPLVFIGKPCDVQAAAAAARRQPGHRPEHRTHHFDLLCRHAFDQRHARAHRGAWRSADAKVTSLRYRGEGWPGRDGGDLSHRRMASNARRGISYEEGWGDILQKHRQWRCHLCADHTGEFADLSVGDPWDKPRDGGDQQGSSLIVVRTERGRAFLQQAIAAGAIIASATPAQRPCRRPAQSGAHPAHPVRAAARPPDPGPLLHPATAAGILRSLWLSRTNLRDKLGSVLGTVRRAIRRKLWLGEVTGGGMRP